MRARFLVLTTLMRMMSKVFIKMHCARHRNKIGILGKARWDERIQ